MLAHVRARVGVLVHVCLYAQPWFDVIDTRIWPFPCFILSSSVHVAALQVFLFSSFPWYHYPSATGNPQRPCHFPLPHADAPYLKHREPYGLMQTFLGHLYPPAYPLGPPPFLPNPSNRSSLRTPASIICLWQRTRFRAPLPIASVPLYQKT